MAAWVGRGGGRGEGRGLCGYRERGRKVGRGGQMGKGGVKEGEKGGRSKEGRGGDEGESMSHRDGARVAEEGGRGDGSFKVSPSHYAAITRASQ